MARMNKVSLARKRELDQPDRFMSMFLATTGFMKQYRKHLSIAAGGIAVLAVIVAGSVYFSKKNEAAASAMLAQVTRQHQAAPDTPMAELKNHYQDIYEKYTETIAGKIARIRYADACYETGEVETAIAAYRDARRFFKKPAIAADLTSSSLAYAHEKSGDRDNAIADFKAIAEEPASPLKANALFNLGRLYEAAGEMEKSREAYATIVSDYPESRVAKIAREKTS
ncbi:MAG: tetratricopeptide repeat protein [Thermodesulfobacteriota bacterium]|nr:tetratricopeptide repeat protein [Thermodesulfobacteriota bacterium]